MIKKQKDSKIIDKVRIIDSDSPQLHLIREAADIIKKGGIVSFPTRCLYGLGADAFNAETVKRIFGIKQRPHNKPLLVLAKNQEDLDRLVQHVPPAASRIIDRFWPGRVTIVFKAKDTLPVNLTAGTGKIGVRLPEHSVTLALLGAVKGPITGTSANISNNPGCSRIPDLDSRIAEELDLILDAGPLKGGIGSTVVDVTTDFPRILREGEIPAKNIFAIFD